MVVFPLFFFKQKTAYEMRISDWSSDVCSSDLQEQPREQRRQGTLIRGPNGALYFVPGSLDVFEVTEEQEKERILSALADDDRKLLEDSPAPPEPQDLQAGKATESGRA